MGKRSKRKKAEQRKAAKVKTGFAPKTIAAKANREDQLQPKNVSITEHSPKKKSFFVRHWKQIVAIGVIIGIVSGIATLLGVFDQFADRFKSKHEKF